MIICTFEDGGTGKLRHVTVTAFIVNKERTHYLLAQRSGKYSEPFKWGPPGGYMDHDETTAETAAREAKEETGWQVRVLQLIRINDMPDRPKEDRQNVDFLYLCEAVDQVYEHDNEIAAIKWEDITRLPSPDGTAFDHYDNIRLCLAYLKQPFSIPVLGKVPSEIFESMY